MSSFRAYVDESIRTVSGFYLFGAVCIEPVNEDPIRRSLLSALPRKQRRFHWRSDSQKQRVAILRLLVDTPTVSMVVYQSRIEPRRAERHRQHLLWNLVASLHQVSDVNDIVFESRESSQNTRDAQTLHSISRAGIAGLGFRYTFARPLDEPLLWLPDAIAGACGHSITDSHGEIADLCNQCVSTIIEVPPLS